MYEFNIVFLKQLIVVVLYGLALSGANICHFKEGQPLNLTCDTNSSPVTSFAWKWIQSNESKTLFNCSVSGCNEVDPSALSLTATVNLDSTNSSVVSSTLTGSLVKVTNNNLTQYSNLICETPKESFNICKSIRIYDNPENVTCYLSNVTSDKILVRCWIYPSGRMEDIKINDKIFSSSTHSSELYSTCTSTAPEPGQTYYTTKCSVYISFNLLRPGNNLVNVTISSEVTEINFTVISNNIIIPVYDELQDPMCSQPDLKVDSTIVTIDCLAPLYLEKVMCLLTDRLNERADIRHVTSVAGNLVLDANKTLAVSCHFVVGPNNLGVGLHELKVTFSGRNSEGNITYKSTNWTRPVSFYLPQDMNFTVNGDPEGVVVNIGDNVTFSCSVDGFPPPTVIISPNPNYIIFFIQKYNFTFTVSGCYSSDVYACSSKESLTGFGNKITKNVYVNIPCPLRLKSDQDNEADTMYVGKFVNTTVVNLEVFGYPRPTSMTLYRSKNYVKSLISEGANVVYLKEQGPYGIIRITFMDKELIKNQEQFTLSVDNGVGNSSFYFYIQEVQVSPDKAGSVLSTTSICLCFVYIMSIFII